MEYISNYQTEEEKKKKYNWKPLIIISIIASLIILFGVTASAGWLGDLFGAEQEASPTFYTDVSQCKITDNGDGTNTYSTAIDYVLVEGQCVKFVDYYSMSVEDGQLKLRGTNWSVGFSPHFIMDSGARYTYSQIPAGIEKDLWKQKGDNYYKYGADFNNVPQNIVDNLKYIVLHRESVENVSSDDVYLEGKSAFINGVEFSHNDILRDFTIPIINKTDIVVKLNSSKYKSNGDGTYNISIDPTITIAYTSLFADGFYDDVGENMRYVSYQKWDISSIPEGSTVSSSILELGFSGSCGGGVFHDSFNLSYIENQGWTETDDQSINNSFGLNYSYATGSPTPTSVAGGGGDGYSNFTITELVQQAFADGNKNLSIRLVEPVDDSTEGCRSFADNGGLYLGAGGIDSVEDRENSCGSNLRPNLIITYSPPPYPGIEFVAPTNATGISTKDNDVIINVSIDEKDLEEVKFDMFGTNSTIYDDNLVFAMNLNNNSNIGENETLVVDFSSYSNNGTTNGVISSVEGKYGNAKEFDGSSEYISIASNGALDLGAEYSIEMWIKPDSVYSWHCLIERGTSSANRYYLYTNGDELTFGQDYSFWTTSGINLEIGKWYHVLAVHNGTEDIDYIYVNGERKGIGYSRTIDPDGTGGELRIGSDTVYTSRYEYNGLIDEIRIWNTSLGPEDMNISYFTNLEKYTSSDYSLYGNFSNLATGTYSYKACANNSQNNQNCTELRTINILDATSPLGTFIAPNSTQLTFPEVYINSSWSETITSAVASINGEANVSMAIDGTYASVFNSSIEDGAYELILCANDTEDNWGCVGPRSFWISTQPPSCEPLYPLGGQWEDARNFDFIYRCNFGGSIPDTIELYHNMTGTYHLNQSNTGYSNYTIGTFSVSDIYDGNYSWTVCANNTEGTYYCTLVGNISFQVDGTDPVPLIDFPEDNFNYTRYISDINVTIVETNPFNCWYVKNGTETVFVSDCSNITDFNSNLGENNISYYVNDSAGNTNYSFITFNISEPSESQPPSISIIYPTAIDYSIEVTALNYTAVEGTQGETVDSCWYSFDGGDVNSSAQVVGTNWTGLSSSIGSNTWTVYCNQSDSVAGSLIGDASVTFTYSPPDIEYPLFSDYWDDNATLIGGGLASFNVTILNTNTTVWLEINGTNYSSSTEGGGVYNISIVLGNGSFDYYWLSWGNGTSTNYNFTETFEYTVNVSIPDIEYPLFSLVDDNNDSFVDSGTGLFNVTVINTNTTVGIEFNGVNYSASNLTSIYNVTLSISSGGSFDYYWFAWGNGTDTNYNFTETYEYTVNVSAAVETPCNEFVIINKSTGSKVFSVNCEGNVSITGDVIPEDDAKESFGSSILRWLKGWFVTVDSEEGYYIDGSPGWSGNCTNLSMSGGIVVGCND